MTDTPTYLLAVEALSIVGVTFSTVFLIITLILHLGSRQVSVCAWSVLSFNSKMFMCIFTQESA